jgi:uncharacterized integral membrane protein
MADERPVESRIKPRHIVVGICVLLLVIFALVNLDDVSVDFAADTVEAPLVLVIVVCALLGFVIGWLVGRRRHDD